jgi:hypothetical protein
MAVTICIHPLMYITVASGTVPKIKNHAKVWADDGCTEQIRFTGKLTFLSAV